MKRLILLLGCALVLLLFVFFSLFPIEVEGLKRKIETEASERLKIEVRLNRALLYLGPLPRVLLEGVELQGPKGTYLAARGVEVHPEILPLLKGRLSLRKVTVRALEAELQLGKGGKGAGIPALRDLEIKGAVIRLKVEGQRERVTLWLDSAHIKRGNGELKVRVLGRGFKVEPLGVKGGRWQGTFSGQEQRWRCSIEGVEVSYPEATLSLKVERDQGGWGLDLRAQGVKVEQVREVALKLNPKATRRIFEIVRGGQVLDLRASSSGGTPQEALQLERMEIRCKVAGGKVHVPAGPLPLEGAKGEMEIKGGVLYVKGAEARLGSSVAHNGRLKLGLKGRDAPVELEAEVKAAAEDLRRYLPRLIKVKGLRDFIGDLKESRGWASGELKVSGGLSRPNVAVEVRALDLSLKHRGVPWPVTLKGGRISVSEEGALWRSVKASFGSSSLEDLQGRLSFEGKGEVEIEGARGTLALEDILGRGRPIEALEGLGAKGRLHLEDLRLKASLMPLKLRKIGLKGRLRQALLTHPSLPGPLKVLGAEIRVEEDLLSFSSAAMELLGSKGRLSGEVPFGGKKGIRLAGEISLSPELAPWLYDTLGLPPYLRPKAPYLFRVEELRWGREWAVKAEASFPKGVSLRIEGEGTKGRLSLKGIHLKGRGEALLSLQRTADSLLLSFRGELLGEDLGRVLPVAYPPKASLKGDLLIRSEGRSKQLRGWLEVSSLPLPLHPSLPPLVIEKLSLQGTGRGRLRVKEGRLRAGRDLLRGWGTLELKGKDLSLQLSVRSKGLDLRPWKALLKGKAAKGGLRLEGRISWRVGALRLGKFTLRGAQGTVHLSRGGTRVDLQRGRVCGIGVRGVLSSTRGLSSLDLTLEAAEAPLRETLRCLGGKEGMADGTFLLEAKLRAKGRKDLLRESSTGSLYLFSAQGRIYRLTLLARLFSVLNVMEMFKGRFPDFTGEGFPYDRLEITGRLKDGRLTIQEGVIEGPALKIFGEGTVDLPTGRLDLVMLVAPLRTVDTLLSRIPLVGQVVTGKSKTFLSFPFKVEGPLQDPKVTPLPPSAIGKGLLGVVKRTLELPFKVIEPVFP